jgi:hypothetical protein
VQKYTHSGTIIYLPLHCYGLGSFRGVVEVFYNPITYLLEYRNTCGKFLENVAPILLHILPDFKVFQ